MEEKDSCYHVPVMLRESLEGLDIRPDGIYVDVTFGGGGHSREILKRLGSEGELYGFDQDEDQGDRPHRGFEEGAEEGGLRDL